MNSIPKVIATIENEIAKLEVILNDENPAIASEQAGLKKLLPFAKLIAQIQTKLEENPSDAPSWKG